MKREDLFIVSKLWNSDHRPDRVIPALKLSLSKLKLDYLDLWLMHGPVSFPPDKPMLSDIKSYDELDKTPVEVTWKCMEQAYEMGLAKAIGVSKFTAFDLHNLLCSCKVVPAVNQVELHPFLHEKELVRFCERRGIVVTGYCPLVRPSSGVVRIPVYPRASTIHLTAAPAIKEVPKDGNLTFASNLPVGEVDVSIMTNPVLVSIAKAHNKTPAQIALRWQLQFGPNLVTIPKTVTPGRPLENISIFDFELTPEEMEQIEGLDIGYRVSEVRRTIMNAL